MAQDWFNALWGGMLIGFAVSMMLFLNGRVTGISGIISGAMVGTAADRPWRLLFVLGLFVGGLLMKALNPQVFAGALQTEDWTVVVAGLLVGFGTVMGSGCTSGHGVCGISRLSPRSMAATIAFMIAGILAVFLFRKLGVIL